MFCRATVFDEFGPFDEGVAIGEEWPILAGLYRHRPERFVYDRSITAYSSSRRMQAQRFGYSCAHFSSTSGQFCTEVAGSIFQIAFAECIEITSLRYAMKAAGCLV